MTLRQWFKEWLRDVRPWDQFGWNHWRYESQRWSGWEYLFRFTIGAVLWVVLWIPIATAISLWRAWHQRADARAGLIRHAVPPAQPIHRERGQ